MCVLQARAEALATQQKLESSEEAHARTKAAMESELASTQAVAAAAHKELGDTMASRLQALMKRLEDSDARGVTCLVAFSREVTALEAEAEALRKQMREAREERDGATRDLASEIERLRTLIRRMAGPAPPPSLLQAVHLESLKRSPNPVVLRTVSSAPALHPPPVPAPPGLPGAPGAGQHAGQHPLQRGATRTRGQHRTAGGAAKWRRAPRVSPLWED